MSSKTPKPVQPFDEASARAGFRAAMVAAAVLVLRGTVQFGRAGSIAFPGLFILFLALVALLPATLLGMFAGGVGCALQSCLRGDAQAGCPAFSFQRIHLLYATCGVALISPFVPGFLAPTRPSLAVASVATGVPEAVSRSAESPPPRFHYDKPADLASADPARFQVIATKRIEDIASTGPLLISPDGLKLAFTTAKNQLVVLELNTFSEICRIPLTSSLNNLAWAPDSRRLAGVVDTGGERRVGIINIERPELIRLPRPTGSEIPDGAISWPEPAEVLLFSQGTAPKAPYSLNLDTLEFRAVAEAPFFKASAEEARAKIALLPNANLPRSTRWSFEIGWTIQSAGPRFADGRYQFKTSGAPCVALRDASTNARTHLVPLTLALNDRVAIAPDGSKVMVARNGEATVHYMDLREASPPAHHLEMQSKPGELPEAAVVEKLLVEKLLFAFVYAPLINPLNNKAVGANWDEVRGIVRLSNWTGSKAEAATVEEFKQISGDDIVSELHHWDEAGVKAVTTYDGTPWWSPLSGQAIRKEAQTSEKTAAIMIEPVLTIHQDAYTSAVTAIADPSLPFPVTAPSVPPLPTVQSGPEGDSTGVDPNVQTIINRFIRQHHAKSSRSDVNGLMEDFADQVRNGRAGMVPKQVLHDEEVKYHAPGTRITELVRNVPTIRKVTTSHYSVVYEVAFLLSKPDGAWTRGATFITLDIELTPAGPRIVGRDSIPRDKERQKGRGAPPSI